jgi:hypothetical protein
MAVAWLKKVAMQILTAFGFQNVVLLILAIVITLFGRNGYSLDFNSPNEVKSIIDSRCSNLSWLL